MLLDHQSTSRKRNSPSKIISVADAASEKIKRSQMTNMSRASPSVAMLSNGIAKHLSDFHRKPHNRLPSRSAVPRVAADRHLQADFQMKDFAARNL
jgi:hypothetical protein